MMALRMMVTGLLMGVLHLLSVRGEADASSTSHVSISLGKSTVQYNNDHIPGRGHYSSKRQHYARAPFYHSTPAPSYHLIDHHSTPAPSYHLIDNHGSPNHGVYGHSALPFFAGTPGPFYHSTPSPLFYGSSPEQNYYVHSTPNYEKQHKVHMPKYNEMDNNHFPVPKGIEKHMEELKEEKVMKEDNKVMKDDKEMEIEQERENEKETEMEKELGMEMKKEKKEEVLKQEKEPEKDKKMQNPTSDSTLKPEIYHPSMPSYTPRPKYHPSEQPLYIPKRHYSPHPVRPIHNQGYHRSYQALHQSKDLQHEVDYKADEVPECAAQGKYYCDNDKMYPEYDIMNAAHKHADQLLALYADVADLNTELSVALHEKADGQESYICPSDITYAQLFRAKNTNGKWRIIVNNIKINYQMLTQTVRLEECLMEGESCPLVPHCYESKCLQKSVYHKFLVFDPYDHYFPFAIESFKLPALCACHIGTYELLH